MFLYLDVSKNRGVSLQNGWFIMENPMNKWMIWGVSHYFWFNTPFFSHGNCYRNQSDITPISDTPHALAENEAVEWKYLGIFEGKKRHGFGSTVRITFEMKTVNVFF